MKTKLVYGIGVMDITGGTRTSPGEVDPAYYRWKMMLRRCYSPEWVERNPTYEGCVVCDEWLIYSNFRDWFYSQGDVTGKELDKDIIDPGNMVYSPTTCVFVDKGLNALLNQRKADRSNTGVIGVSFRTGKYNVFCKVNGSNVYLGRYDDLQTASKVYRDYKSDYIRSWIDRSSDQRIKSGLEKHIQLLEDGTYGNS